MGHRSLLCCPPTNIQGSVELGLITELMETHNKTLCLLVDIGRICETWEDVTKIGSTRSNIG